MLSGLRQASAITVESLERLQSLNHSTINYWHTMQQIKKTADYTVYQKKSGRYAVRAKNKQWLHADDKAKVLLAEALIAPPKEKAPAPAAEAEGETAEAPAES